MGSILLFCLLAMVLYVAHGQSPTCTINMPNNPCQPPNMSVDDQFVKSSIIALQTQIQQLINDNVKLRQDVDNVIAGSRSPAMLKQCSRRGLNDGRQSGVIMDCNFVKQRGDTVLRVAWNGDLRLKHNGPNVASCRRWYFTMNGNECGDPKPIDTQLQNNMKVINMHHPNYVEGYCRGLSAGAVLVAWNVGDCLNPGYSTGDSYTGWMSTVRITVEEINVEDANENIN